MATAFDAIVVGSGACGGWAAKELADAGMKILMLEAGRAYEALEFLEAAAGLLSGLEKEDSANLRYRFVSMYVHRKIGEALETSGRHADAATSRVRVRFASPPAPLSWRSGRGCLGCARRSCYAAHPQPRATSACDALRGIADWRCGRSRTCGCRPPAAARSRRWPAWLCPRS